MYVEIDIEDGDGRTNNKILSIVNSTFTNNNALDCRRRCLHTSGITVSIIDKWKPTHCQLNIY